MKAPNSFKGWKHSPQLQIPSAKHIDCLRLKGSPQWLSRWQPEAQEALTAGFPDWRLDPNKGRGWAWYCMFPHL